MNEEIVNKADVWRKRSDKENADTNLDWLANNVVDFSKINLNKTPWIFSNIPKTAGKALDNYLTQAFALTDILNVNAVEFNALPQCLYLKNKLPKAISGQFSLSELVYQLIPNQEIVHLSMMRDPIFRVIFLYNDIATKKYHEEDQNTETLDFDAFIKQDDLLEINNGQARRFAGLLDSELTISDKDLYKKAKYAIDNCYSLVGLSEQFRQFYELLGKKCGIKFHNLAPIVRSKLKVQLSDLNDNQLAIIEQKNKVDIQLYQYVKTLFAQRLNEF